MTKRIEIERLSLADQIRIAIHKSKMSVNAVSRETEIPQPVLHRFMTGERDNLRLDTADKLCRFFGMTLTQPKRANSVAITDNASEKRGQTPERANRPGRRRKER